jgi:hypothetical protein
MKEEKSIIKTMDAEETCCIYGGNGWYFVFGIIIDGWADIKRGLYEGSRDAAEYMKK